MDKYTYEQAFNDSVKYFNGDELAAKAFLDKYALRNNKDEILENTPEKMHVRLASEFARIQKNKYKSPLSKDSIFNLLNRFEKIIPQGSPMFGIGNNFQVCSISNCFVLDIPEDSYNSILDVDKQLVNISKRRGGVGIDLSKLRPRGSATNNAARSSTGIISWMERYSNSIREVGQHGRRGALMLTLSVHHPDILDFSTIKNDNSKVTGANISVRLSQEFLDAVKNDSEYELRFPVDYKETEQKPKVSKFVKAKEIWKTIIKSAWMRAEPGLVMWDNVLKGPADCYEKYRSVTSNPCQPGWAKLITKDGVKQLKDINVGEKVWSESGWTTVVKKWSTGVKDVYKYETTSGVFYGTENHKLVSNGEKVEARDCESIDILPGPFDSSVAFDNQDIMDGMVIGDGTVHKCSNSLILLCIGKDDGDYFSSEVASLITKYREGINEFVYEIKTSITVDELPYTYNRKVPSRFLYGNKNKVCGFLRGLYTANGSVCGERVTLKTTSKNMVEDVQCMLSSIGISSYYTTNKATNVEFSNGTYLCKESYDINITKDRNKFAQIIGFIQQYKTDKVNELITSKWKSKHASKPSKLSYDIKNVQLVSTEEVFDLTVDNQQHTYWTQGCNVSNCSEIFMPSLESCRLLAINLFGYVKNPFTKNSYFDYDEFYKETKIAQRLMDDVVDLESEKIDQIIAKVKSDPESEEIKKDEINLWERIKKLNDECRRTGLGITAIGDTLAAIGVKYGSEESIAVTEKIYQTLKLAAYESSIEMAEELGSFKDYDAKKEENCEFIQLIKAERPDLYERMVKVGRRNIALTTTAPTGCSVGSSMVISDQGIIRFDEMIKETENGFYEIENLNVIQEKRNASYKVSKKFVNGLANTKKIVLKSGIELESTLNHQYRVLENGEYLWRKVGDLKIGDALINRIGGYDKFTEEDLEIPNLDAFNNHNNKDINLPVSINEELSELLGIIYADGSVHEKGIRIHIDRNEKELIGRICQLVSNQFGLYPTVIQEKTCASIYINSLIILDYLKLNGMLKGFCETVSIPLKIRKSSKKSILSFIHGYWLGDGSESKGCRYIDTVSKQMAQDIAICLRAVGQNIHISKHENRENSFGNLPLYRVFLIGFGSENFEKYRYIQRNLKETFKIVKNIGETLFFDKIESLEDSKAFTYDIEVPENNCYVLNSFISHNTVSLMAQTSSGIEPVFSLGYKRRKKINPNDKNGRIDFVDQNGDSWQEFMVYHHKVKQWIDVTGNDKLEDSPWWGATANEIDWINRVKLQAAAQKHVCHAISSTINLPETVTEEKVAEIYETAFASGVKGITIYRDNCRTGVLVSKEEKKKENKINHNNAPKRPQVLDADVHHLSYQNNRYYVVVGLLEKDPYEIFIGLNNDGEGDVVIPKSIKAGFLAKEGKGKYVLKTEDFSCVLKNTHTDENADVLARMLSSALRHGCSIEFLTHQLEKTKGGLTSFSKILSRAIKKYIKDGVVVSGEACSECGGKLVRESGCKICKGTEEKAGCGWTACN